MKTVNCKVVGEKNPYAKNSEETRYIKAYSRVPNITVGLNKSVGGNFSWKLIKK